MYCSLFILDCNVGRTPRNIPNEAVQSDWTEISDATTLQRYKLNPRAIENTEALPLCKFGGTGSFPGVPGAGFGGIARNHMSQVSPETFLHISVSAYSCTLS